MPAITVATLATDIARATRFARQHLRRAERPVTLRALMVAVEHGADVPAAVASRAIMDSIAADRFVLSTPDRHVRLVR